MRFIDNDFDSKNKFLIFRSKMIARLAARRLTLGARSKYKSPESFSMITDNKRTKYTINYFSPSPTVGSQEL